jgi:hypothetical protein
LRFPPPERAAHAQQFGGNPTSELPPDLAGVVAAWPALPETIRTGILALVKAANGTAPM